MTMTTKKGMMLSDLSVAFGSIGAGDLTGELSLKGMKYKRRFSTDAVSEGDPKPINMVEITIPGAKSSEIVMVHVQLHAPWSEEKTYTRYVPMLDEVELGTDEELEMWDEEEPLSSSQTRIIEIPRNAAHVAFWQSSLEEPEGGVLMLVKTYAAPKFNRPEDYIDGVEGEYITAGFHIMVTRR